MQRPAFIVSLLLLSGISAMDAATAHSAARPGAQPVTDTSSIAKAAWLAGCWELRTGGRVTQEHWMAPAGGAMIGMSRTVVRDTLREFEYLRIVPVAGRLAYVATPSGQRETAFPSTTMSDTLLVFENPAHDFPQRIRYRRVDADSIVARIEGPRNGQTRGIDFPLRRARCE